MPDRVHPLETLERVKNESECVGQSSIKNQLDRDRVHLTNQPWIIPHNHPAHCQVKDQREGTEPSFEKGLKNNSQNGQKPDHTQNDDSRRAVKGSQTKSGITSRNENVNRQMVERLES